MDGNAVPGWLRALLADNFFDPCCVHHDAKKNEKNVFCLDCSASICAHCLPLHSPLHRLFQVRRYVYHDVLRLADAQKLMNCSSVQPYTTNSAKVVFLKQRPLSRPFRGSGNFCNTCDRSLQDPFLFCSLSCKVHHLLTTKNGIKKHIYGSQFRPVFDKDQFDDDRVTPDTVLDSPPSLGTSSGSTTSSVHGVINFRGALACSATTEFVRRKRSTVAVPRTSWLPVLSSPSSESAAAVSRRKSVPQRSPLY